VHDLQELSDRTEIHDVVTQMAWCQDRRDWAGLDNVLAEELDVDYSPGTVGPVTGVPRAHVVDNWREALERVDASQHVLAGVQVTLHGEAAEVRLNELVWLTRASAEGSPLYHFGTAMQLRLGRFPAGWRITSVTVRASWSDGNAAVLGGYSIDKP